MNDLALAVDVLPIKADRLGLTDARPAEEFGEVCAFVLKSRTLPAVLAFLQLPTRLANLGNNLLKLLG